MICIYGYHAHMPNVKIIYKMNKGMVVLFYLSLLVYYETTRRQNI
jgi:hypothetical protein